MQFSVLKSILLVCGLAVTLTLALPMYYGEEDVEVRAPATIQSLESRNSLPSTDLDDRGLGSGVGEVAEMIVNVVGMIKAGIAEDKNKRSQFTQDLVQEMNSKNSKFNYVVCHTKHKAEFDGTQGKDWGHSHQEFDIKIGGTVGYEIYWAKSGKFTRQGDGGYLNWAYMGNVKSKSNDGKEIVFGPR